MTLNRRNYIKLLSSASTLSVAKWSIPTIVSVSLPAHAQATSADINKTAPIIESTDETSIRANLNFCVDNFNGGNPVTPANLSASTIELNLVGDFFVSPVDQGDVIISNVSSEVVLSSGTTIPLLAPPTSLTIVPDASGRAVVTGNPLANFVQQPVAPFLDPTAGNAPSYPAVITIRGDASYNGITESFTASGTVDATGSSISFSMSSPDTGFCLV